MSIIFYIGAGMSFKEKSAWIMALVTIGTYWLYLSIILQRAETTAITEVAYVWPMLWVIAASIVAMIVAHISVAILVPGDADKEDVRDRQITRFGEYIGQSLVVAGALTALVMAMLELHYFWIANVIYLGFVLSSILGSVVKIAAYRWGLPRW